MTYGVMIVGSTEHAVGWLARVLRESGFKVAVSDPEMFSSGALARENPDVLIVDSAAVRSSDEDFFSLLVNARGFLLLLDRQQERVAGGELLHPGLSAEEVVSRVNSVIFRYSNVRRHRRIAVRIEAEYRTADRCSMTTMHNLSVRGAFLSTLNPAREGDVILLTFDAGPEHTITVRSRVLYSVGYDLERSIISHPSVPDKSITALPGMGVFFEDLSEDDRLVLELFIEVNACQEDVVQ